MEMDIASGAGTGSERGKADAAWLSADPLAPVARASLRRRRALRASAGAGLSSPPAPGAPPHRAVTPALRADAARRRPSRRRPEADGDGVAVVDPRDGRRRV